jgi:RNA polymerase sigma-70 factor (ECF subfamily)
VSTRAALDLVASLPADQAEAIILRVVAGLDVGQVAEVMGKPPGHGSGAHPPGLRRLAVRLSPGARLPGAG